MTPEPAETSTNRTTETPAAMAATTDPPVVTLASAADVVAVIPIYVGFHPTASVVLVGMSGPRHRWVGPVMRYDLDIPADVAVPGLVATLAGHGADAVFAAVFCDDSHGDGRETDDGSHDGIADVVRAAADAQGLELYDLVHVHDGRWWSFLCTDLSCCPRGGTSVPDGTTGAAAALAAHAVAEGRVVLPSRTELETTVAGPVGLAAAASMYRLDHALDRMATLMSADGVDAVHGRAVELWHDAVAARADRPGELDADEAAFVVAALELKRIRDDVMTLTDAPLPAILEYACALARVTPDPVAASVCTVVACLAMRAGNGALANVAIDRALRNDPGHQLAGILERMSAAMLSPAIVERWCAEARAMSPTWGSAA